MLCQGRSGKVKIYNTAKDGIKLCIRICCSCGSCCLGRSPPLLSWMGQPWGHGKGEGVPIPSLFNVLWCVLRAPVLCRSGLGEDQGGWIVLLELLIVLPIAPNAQECCKHIRCMRHLQRGYEVNQICYSDANPPSTVY